jgi:hypothetical protein
MNMTTYEQTSDRLPWIALMGKAGAGKDTAAQVLVDTYGYTRVSFADGVRTALLALNPIVATGSVSGFVRLAEFVRAIGWEEAKRTNSEVRTLLQHMGTDAIRTQDPHFWCRAAERKSRMVDGPVVFTDTRFLNELRMVTEYHGIAVLVERAGQPVLKAQASMHVSELEWTQWAPDHTLHNSGNISQFKTQVQSLMEDEVIPTHTFEESK